MYLEPIINQILMKPYYFYSSANYFYLSASLSCWWQWKKKHVYIVTLITDCLFGLRIYVTGTICTCHTPPPQQKIQRGLKKSFMAPWPSPEDNIILTIELFLLVYIFSVVCHFYIIFDLDFQINLCDVQLQFKCMYWFSSRSASPGLQKSEVVHPIFFRPGESDLQLVLVWTFSRSNMAQS